MRTGSHRTPFIWGTVLGIFLAGCLVVANDVEFHFWEGSQGPGVDSNQDRHVALFLNRVPLGYTVHVDGSGVDAEHHASGVSLFVSQGPHTISLQGPEGLVWAETISATRPDTLNPQFGGDIVVDILPQATGGDLFINGSSVGTAPGAVSGVIPGWHRVSVQAQGEVIYEEACFVSAGRVTVISVPPPPAQGRGQLHVKSRILTEIGFQPLQGSSVFVNGELQGKVPLTLDLPRGFHSVRVEHRTQDTYVEVLYLPAGQTRQVLADFGREDRLQVSTVVPSGLRSGKSAAIPVTVECGDDAVELSQGEILLVRGNQTKPLAIPLSAVNNDHKTWLAYLPADLVQSGTLTGYANCQDVLGRSGQSELFSVTVP